MKIEISTPSKSIAPQEVSQVTLPTEKGEAMILPGHATLITKLGSGTLSFQSKGETKSFEISGGVAEIENDHIIVACDSIIS